MKRFPPDLIAVSAFLTVAEVSSFTKAARRLGVAKSIISRRVSQLEEQLGAQLLVRSAKGAHLTEIGRSYFSTMADLMGAMEAAHEAAASSVTQIAGPIRLTAPVSFGISVLAPILARFAQQHPEVALDISFDDRAVDLVGGGFDLAVRIGILPDSSLLARKLASLKVVLVGSPRYLEQMGTPTKPADLRHHHLLTYSNASEGERWQFVKNGKTVFTQVNGMLRADNGEMLGEAAAADLGLVVIPEFIVAKMIKQGRLRALLTDYEMPDLGVFSVTLPHRTKLARVKTLGDFLYGELALRL